MYLLTVAPLITLLLQFQVEYVQKIVWDTLTDDQHGLRVFSDDISIGYE